MSERLFVRRIESLPLLELTTGRAPTDTPPGYTVYPPTLLRIVGDGSIPVAVDTECFDQVIPGDDDHVK